ncbi:MAG: flagellar biosynthetic protein FliQ, partial [Deltaproteobacteria bacterium]|nr:flagellar biosynthetic protein FliQ [Deltaproteobacteria bacterium]
ILLLIRMPLMLTAHVVCMHVSVFQAETQIQEMTLAFITKIVYIFVVLIFLFPWMLGIMVDYSRNIIINIPQYVR